MQSARALLTFVARAENRVDALLAVADGPATRPTIQEETDIPRATLSRILADFRERDLVVRDGHDYAITPLGEVLASELRDAIEAIAAVLTLAEVREWLSLEAFEFPVSRLADADVVVPSTPDPTAPIRRAETLLAEAERVRLVANSMIPGCLEAVWGAVTADHQRLEWVTTPDALSVVADDPTLARWTRDLLQSDSATGYVHEEGFPQALFVVDGTVFTPVSDDAGTVRGHVETDDDVVRAWAEETIDGYVEAAAPIDVGVLTA